MAFIDCHFFAETLGISASMYVVLPEQTRAQIGMRNTARGMSEAYKHPVLYLLHGLSDDHTIWMRRTSIERYASELGLAVIMPAVNRSFYTNMPNGHRYWDFISEELPEKVRSFFPISDRREDTFVAGLSMGGYGALKLGLTHPERYAAAASLSGVTDLARRIGDWEGPEFRLLFGDYSSIPGTNHDLFHLSNELVKGMQSGRTVQPKLFQCCGTEDFLYEDNVRFRDHARELGLKLTYEEGPGSHEWGYWDENIKRVLAWLPLEVV